MSKLFFHLEKFRLHLYDLDLPWNLTGTRLNERKEPPCINDKKKTLQNKIIQSNCHRDWSTKVSFIHKPKQFSWKFGNEKESLTDAGGVSSSPLLEAILLPLVEQVCFGAAQVHDFRTSVPLHKKKIKGKNSGSFQRRADPGAQRLTSFS